MWYLQYTTCVVGSASKLTAVFLLESSAHRYANVNDKRQRVFDFEEHKVCTLCTDCCQFSKQQWQQTTKKSFAS